VKSLYRHFVKAATLFLLVLMAFSLSLPSRLFFVKGSNEASLIEEAESKLHVAFEAVLEAESVGANVSGLIARLNEAGELLAEAEIADKIGSFSEAVSKAEQCSVLADGVMDEAITLKGEVLAGAQIAFWQDLTVTAMGSAVFLVAMFFVWGWFKRAYAKKLLRMKLEVASDVEA